MWSPSVLPPINEDILIYFITHCYEIMKLQLSTIKLYLCGIRFQFLQHSGVNPLSTLEGNSLPRLAMLLQAIKKSQVSRKRIRLPITFTVLTKLCGALQCAFYTSFFKRMLHTAFCVAFYGFLRAGEFTYTGMFDPSSHLCVGDIIFNECEHYAILHLKSSKTDPGRKGVSIRLFRNNLTVCPYQALMEYVKIRTIHGAVATDPLFVIDSGTPLTRSVFITALKDTLTLANIDSSQYSGHSFRSGAATSAAKARLEDHLIKTLGRWQSDSYVRYIKTPISCLRDAQLAMSADHDS